jgi:hypothetical protein
MPKVRYFEVTTAQENEPEAMRSARILSGAIILIINLGILSFTDGMRISDPASRASIEKIWLNLSGLMENGADQDKTRFLGIINCVRLKAEATETGCDVRHWPPNAGEVGE